MRQDPPFDMAYITATHLLELLQEEGPLVVNDPAAVRNAPEKLFVLRFKELMPPTLLTLDRPRNPRILARARRHHRQAAVRQRRRRRVPSAARRREFERTDRDVRRIHREPVMVQRYLPEVRQGDKRIILVEGEPVGAVNRVPPEGEARANLHVGGRAERRS